MNTNITSSCKEVLKSCTDRNFLLRLTVHNHLPYLIYLICIFFYLLIWWSFFLEAFITKFVETVHWAFKRLSKDGTLFFATVEYGKAIRYPDIPEGGKHGVCVYIVSPEKERPRSKDCLYYLTTGSNRQTLFNLKIHLIKIRWYAFYWEHSKILIYSYKLLLKLFIRNKKWGTSSYWNNHTFHSSK